MKKSFKNLGGVAERKVLKIKLKNSSQNQKVNKKVLISILHHHTKIIQKSITEFEVASWGYLLLRKKKVINQLLK